MGGLIAWEMATLQPTAKVVLIDSTWPDPPMSTPSEVELHEWFHEDVDESTASATIDAATTEEFLGIFSSNATAFATHSPTSAGIHGRIVYGSDTDPDMWRRFEDAELQVDATAFGHYELMREPDAVATVADSIRRTLGVEP